MADTGWRRNKYGGLFNINEIENKKETNQYMNNKIRNAINKKQTFDTIDADNATEYNQKRKDYVNQNMVIDDTISKDGLRGKLKAMIDNKIAGTIDYSKKEDGQIGVVYVHVNDDYRRLGIATKLYKRLQSKTPNQDIAFGEFTDNGEKLINKIGVITKKETNKDGFTIHYGRIK